MAEQTTGAAPAAAEPKTLPATKADLAPVGVREAGSALAAFMGVDANAEAPLDPNTGQVIEQPAEPAPAQPRDPKTGQFAAAPAETPAADDTGAEPVADEAIPDDAWEAALPQSLRDLLQKGRAATGATPQPTAEPQPADDQAAQQRAAQLERTMDKIRVRLMTEFADFKPGDNSDEASDARIALATEAPARAAAYQQLMAEHRNAATEHSGIARSQYDAMYQRNVKALGVLVPEWSEPAKMQAGVAEVKKYMAEEIAANSRALGRPVSAEAAAGIAARSIDPIELSMARKAMLYDRLQAAQVKARAAAMKKVAGVPPVQVPGARTAATVQQQNGDLAALRARALESKKATDLGAFLGRALNIG